MNARLQLRLLRKPDAKPIYARQPNYGAVIVDNREKWRERWDAEQSEQTRLAAIERSAQTRNPE